jgi:hypothetical protein
MIKTKLIILNILKYQKKSYKIKAIPKYIKEKIPENKEFIPVTERKNVSLKGFKYEENISQNLLELKKILEIPNFKNEQIFVRALTHESYSNQKIENNTKLSLLGKYALDLLTNEIIIEKNEKVNESQISYISSFYLNRSRLLYFYEKYNIKNFVRCGDNLDLNRISLRKFETNFIYAIIGSIYDQLGHEETKKYINNIILKDDIKTCFYQLISKEYINYSIFDILYYIKNEYFKPLY